MADRETKRKCFKCGCSPALDNVRLFRFLKPGVTLRNLSRCEHWAKFIFPERAPTLTLLHKLHSEHRMLCQQHFQDADFVDETKQQLNRDAIPMYHASPTTDCEPTIAAAEVVNPVQRVAFRDLTNYPSTSVTITHTTVSKVSHPTNCEPIITAAEVINPLQIDTFSEPTDYHSTSATITHTTVSEVRKQKINDNLNLIKCRKYLKKICELRNRIRSVSLKNKLAQINNDVAVKKLSKKITPAFAILLQGQ
ncbi:uncharacterized protein [Epargyreus clarus]|uniref:uncharacterized protein n=1 Tax=Epargyreus clarus TaxID=520877 RepID=UPI003C2E4627